MFINLLDCSACLFIWYGLLIMVGGVGGGFSQTHKHSNLRRASLLTVVRPVVLTLSTN